MPYIPYPRWIQPQDGSARRIVQNAEEETSFTGVLMNPDGTVAENVDPPPPAPTIDAPHEPTQEEREAVFAEEPKIQAGHAEPQPEVLAPTETPVTEPTAAKEVPVGDNW